MGKSRVYQGGDSRCARKGTNRGGKTGQLAEMGGPRVANLLHNRTGTARDCPARRGAHMKVRTLGLGLVLAGFTLASVPAWAQDPKGGGAPGGGASERSGGGGAAAGRENTGS